MNDTNVLAVVTYAVHALGVQHVVIAGHSACGGAAACAAAAAAAALPVPSAPEDSALNVWLKPMTELAAGLGDCCTSLPPSPHFSFCLLMMVMGDSALDELVAANVRAQVDNAAASAPIQAAWDAGKEVWVHGWVYDLATGRLRDLACSRGPGLSK